MTQDRVIAIKIIAVAIVVIVLFSGCRRHSGAWQTMDSAESVMEERPDSALAILEEIDGKELSGDEEKARFALLMSMALDKNYIDTTNFNVLQPAIDYYLKKGLADEKLKTYYYQGRIFQNLGDDESAMQSFLNAKDMKDEIDDPMILARNYVALGTLYHKQYKIADFIECNLQAAHLYEMAGKDRLQIRSYSKAIGGYIMLDDKEGADSIMSVCLSLVKDYPEGKEELYSSFLLYTIEYGSDEEIKAYLRECHVPDLRTNDALNVAYGYSKIGESGKAMEIVSSISPEESSRDSLKYLLVKTKISERQGDYEKALALYKEYSDIKGNYQYRLLSQDLLFSDERHQLELTNLLKLKQRDRIIWCVLSGTFTLLLLACWLYYRYRLSQSKRLMAEKDNENLRLAQENLKTEKERAELQRELQVRNLLLEKNQLEQERDNLKDLLEEQSELSKSIRKVITGRLDMLNGLLAKEISNNDTYAKRLIESMRNNRNEFLNSTRQAFSASHPGFIAYLEQHQLTVEEINYLCLYAIGLRGKDVGQYLQLKRHYNISSDIRKKIGLDEHDTNLGIYVRQLMNEL